MTSGDAGAPPPASGEEGRAARNVGVGCFTVFVGFWSGGMIGVLIGKFVDAVRRAPSCEGVPLCDWHYYWFAGAALGAISLPILVLRRLRRR